MFLRILLLAATSLAVPLPQGLTEEQFQQKSSRGLDVPSVRISKSYASVRRQGDGGSSNLISFPALSVRDPEELAPDFSQKFKSSVGPVFKPVEKSRIEDEIRKINEAEVEAREIVEKALEEEIELEEEFAEAEEASGDDALEVLSDILAEEIVEDEMEKLDELTDLAAIEMVAEEALDEILDENLEFDIIAEADDSENEIIEGSGLSQLDFGSITEVTK